MTSEYMNDTIIASGEQGGKRFQDVILTADNNGGWGGVSNGSLICVGPDNITDWHPAVVTATGRGVMDDRDKRDRVDAEGRTWMWNPLSRSWTTYVAERRMCDYGTLPALGQAVGPLRFADEEANVLTPAAWHNPDPVQPVEPFRHPFISGKDICVECERAYEAHGWIDRGSHGFTVCPFDFTPTSS